MAHPIETARRKASATNRLHRAAQHIQKQHPKVKDIAIGGVSKDGDVNQAELLESLATFLEVFGDVPAVDPFVNNHDDAGGKVVEPMTDDEPPPSIRPKKIEPQFAGKPLSHFDGMTDDQMMKVKGVKHGTLKQIHDARAARDGDDE